MMEAKSGKAGKDFQAIQQLITAWRRRGTSVQNFHGMTTSQTEQHKVLTEALSIKIISLPSSDRATWTFALDDQAFLLPSIEQALQGEKWAE